jgi:ABC-type sugar transport system ATPase subunit
MPDDGTPAVNSAGADPSTGAGPLQLEVSRLRKRYGETRALDGLDLTASAGEVLGIAGPNGAGKSTLVRVLAGEDPGDSGDVLLGGRPWTLPERQHNVALVHQEPKLFPTLTVADNLMVGVEPTRLLRPSPTARDIAIVEELGLTGSASTPVEECSLVTQQLVEIARAILRDASAFLFDEPNSALTVEESEHLFSHIERLRAGGRCVVVLITHRLNDLVTHCDRVAVVRDGRVAVMLEGDRLTTANLGQAIAGTWESTRPPANGVAAERPAVAEETQTPVIGAPLLSAEGWSDRTGRTFADVTVEVRQGEVLVITGQEGAGGRELIQSFAGLRSATGSLAIGGESTARAREGRLCYIPADRTQALFPNFSVAANLASRLGRRAIAGTSGILRVPRLLRRGRDLVDRLSIRTESARAAIGSLSGGNQQKVSVGSALAVGPQVLLIEEPTRGVDVATKEDIYSSLRSYAAHGNAVIAFSPELDVVFRLADTARVIVEGRLSEPREIGPLGGLDELADWVDRIVAGRAHGPDDSETSLRNRPEGDRS